MTKSKESVDRNYVSPFSNFLQEISTEENNESPAIKQEVEKYTKVDNLRDNVQKSEDNTGIWKGF